jgi:hypothetical protein
MDFAFNFYMCKKMLKLKQFALLSMFFTIQLLNFNYANEHKGKVNINKDAAPIECPTQIQ